MANLQHAPKTSMALLLRATIVGGLLFLLPLILIAVLLAHAIESGWVQVNQGLGQVPGMSYGGYKQSGIGREFSLEGMLDSFTQRKNVTVNLNTPRKP